MSAPDPAIPDAPDCALPADFIAALRDLHSAARATCDSLRRIFSNDYLCSFPLSAPRLKAARRSTQGSLRPFAHAFASMNKALLQIVNGGRVTPELSVTMALRVAEIDKFMSERLPPPPGVTPQQQPSPASSSCSRERKTAPVVEAPIGPESPVDFIPPSAPRRSPPRFLDLRSLGSAIDECITPAEALRQYFSRRPHVEEKFDASGETPRSPPPTSADIARPLSFERWRILLLAFKQDPTRVTTRPAGGWDERASLLAFHCAAAAVIDDRLDRDSTILHHLACRHITSDRTYKSKVFVVSPSYLLESGARARYPLPGGCCHHLWLTANDGVGSGARGPHSH